MPRGDDEIALVHPNARTESNRQRVAFIMGSIQRYMPATSEFRVRVANEWRAGNPQGLGLRACSVTIDKSPATPDLAEKNRSSELGSWTRARRAHIPHALRKR